MLRVISNSLAQVVFMSPNSHCRRPMVFRLEVFLPSFMSPNSLSSVETHSVECLQPLADPGVPNPFMAPHPKFALVIGPPSNAEFDACFT